MNPSNGSLVDELLDARLTPQVRSILWSRVLLDALREQERTPHQRARRRAAETWVVLRPPRSHRDAA